VTVAVDVTGSAIPSLTVKVRVYVPLSVAENVGDRLVGSLNENVAPSSTFSPFMHDHR
jgi:hypothetical protein